MNKKLICLVLAMVMLCMAPLAYAATSPDTAAKTTPKSGSSTATVTEPLSVTAVGLTAAAQGVLAEIKTFDGDDIEFFGADVKAAVAALLPAGSDLSALKVLEFSSIALTGFDPYYGDVVVDFVFAAKFPDGAPIVALLGFETATGVEWMTLKAEVINGKVYIYFTQAALIALNGRTGMLAILSEEI